jgi:hypothetical protein
MVRNDEDLRVTNIPLWYACKAIKWVPGSFEEALRWIKELEKMVYKLFDQPYSSSSE